MAWADYPLQGSVICSPLSEGGARHPYGSSAGKAPSTPTTGLLARGAGHGPANSSFYSPHSRLGTRGALKRVTRQGPLWGKG